MANTSVIVIPEGKICDYVDGKFRNDTPEEYVRQTSVLVLGTTGEGNRTVSHEQKRKVEDDQTPDVPAIFAEWKIKEGLAW